MQTLEDADVPDGVELYDFEDFASSRKLLYNDTREALMKQFPKEHNGVRMELLDVDYVDPEEYSVAEQKKALLDDAYLGRRLRGRVRLTDSTTGQVLDEKNMTLMKVPYLTERGTFIREGNEWGTISQQRLIPGAYSRYQKNGDLETQFNVRPGTGKAFRVNLNPATSQYKFSVAGSELQLYSLLRDIGVSDDEMREAWGDDVLAENKRLYDPRVFEKAYNKIVPDWERKQHPERTREEKAAMIKAALERSQIATAVAKRTLPNLFSREKAASWRQKGYVFEKLASAKKADLVKIGQYLNRALDEKIALDAPREELVEQIRNTLRTGVPDGEDYMSKVAKNKDVVKLVRQMQKARLYKDVEKHVISHGIGTDSYGTATH